MTENYEFLPIGTIVLLKNGTKRVMITGYLPIVMNEEVFFDYCGCIYPEGYLDSSSMPLFNRDNIDKIIYMGNKDDEEVKKYMATINELYLETEKIVKKQELSNTDADIDDFTKIE